MDDIWSYRNDTYREGRDLRGFDVEAIDGGIGSVDEDTTGREYLIVDTGFWVFGKRRLLPAGVVTDVDYDDEKVYVVVTKDQIKNAPDVDESLDRTRDDWDRAEYVTYYRPFIT